MTAQNITPGTKIYYTGDAANHSGFGEIIMAMPANRWGPGSLRVRLDDGREMFIERSAFEPSIGRRFMTLDEYNTKRAEEIAKAAARYREMGLIS